MISLQEIRVCLRVCKIGIVAKESGVSRASIYRIMNGGDCTVSTLEKLTEFFKKRGLKWVTKSECDNTSPSE
jgi:predicted transcriptional regulator